jgi:hypothetical protein
MSRKRSQVKRVHIEGEEWTYQVGTSTVSIRDPQGRRVNVLRSKVVRGQPHNYQRNFDPDYAGPMREADTFTYPTPALVKNYIWRKLRPGQLIKEPGDYEQAKDAILRYFEGDVKQEPERIARAQR